MKDKAKYDDIALDAQNAIKRIKWDLDMNHYGTDYGLVSYNIYNFIAVYKIQRMKSLGLIDEKEYYKLMKLYYKYLELNYNLDELENIAHCHYLQEGHYLQEDEDLEIKLRKQIKRVEKKLGEYELLENNVEFDELIDSQIRLLHTKNSK